MDGCNATLRLKWLVIFPHRTTMGVKLFLYVPELADEIEQIGMQLATVIHS